MELETLDAAAVSYIRELEAGYKQEIKELQNTFDASVNELQSNLKELQYKYFEIKERSDVSA